MNRRPLILLSIIAALALLLALYAGISGEFGTMLEIIFKTLPVVILIAIPLVYIFFGVSDTVKNILTPQK
jgi:hypothetical protein